MHLYRTLLLILAQASPGNRRISASHARYLLLLWFHRAMYGSCSYTTIKWRASSKLGAIRTPPLYLAPCVRETPSFTCRLNQCLRTTHPLKGIDQPTKLQLIFFSNANIELPAVQSVPYNPNFRDGARYFQLGLDVAGAVVSFHCGHIFSLLKSSASGGRS